MNLYWYISCVIFFFIGSGAVALAHLDGAGTEDAATAMVQRVTELALGYPEGRVELQLVGGYSDPRNYSEELFYNILCEYLLKKYISIYIFINQLSIILLFSWWKMCVCTHMYGEERKIKSYNNDRNKNIKFYL